MKNDLKNIYSFNLRFSEDSDKYKTSVVLFSDFDNVDAFNKSLNSMENIILMALKESNHQDNVIQDFIFRKLTFRSNFTWDGKKMGRAVNFVNTNTKEEQNDNFPTEPMLLDMRYILSANKIHMRYHFPKKIDTVSDFTALLSQDGKTVVTGYQLDMAISQKPEDAYIEIKLKDDL